MLVYDLQLETSLTIKVEETIKVAEHVLTRQSIIFNNEEYLGNLMFEYYTDEINRSA
jgi:hypothetical protein